MGHANLAAPVSCLFFKTTCQIQKPSKIHRNKTCQFQSLDICARQFLWLSAGEKIGILPSWRLQSVTSSWVWFKWTTYRFSVGITHTRATQFPHRICVLIPEWTQLRAWKRAFWIGGPWAWEVFSKSFFIWRDFPLGPLNLTACLWVWAWPCFRLSFTAWQNKPGYQWNRKLHSSWKLLTFSSFNH